MIQLVMQNKVLLLPEKVASETNALIGIGPTCSGVAAASFGVFRKK